MNLLNLLTEENVFLDLKSSTKDEVIEELIDRLKGAGKIGNRAEALRAIFEREQKMSTGIENGIAVPHGKTDSVDSLVVGMGISKTGIEFASLDGEPCRIFVMTLSPPNRTGPHIQFLSEVSRLLNDRHIREDLLKAATVQEALKAIFH